MSDQSPHLSPAQPTGNRWWVSHASTRTARAVSRDSTTTVWWGRGLVVISSAMDAEYQGVVVPHNHVSVALHDHRRRPNDKEMGWVRADFDMEDAEEDNHLPGVARHLFLPLHLPRGTEGICDCKADETLVVEPDGFRWSKTKAAAR